MIRFANIYRHDGSAAKVAAPVPVVNGPCGREVSDISRLLWEVKFEEGLISPDYDLCQTKAAAQASAEKRQVHRAKVLAH